ncbi:cytosolic leucyl tRNA synthetase, partial [Ceratobasidium sp. 414]
KPPRHTSDPTAKARNKALKIQSQKDTKQITKAKDIADKEVFYGRTMLIGLCKGTSMQDAKPKVQGELITSG